ncbi:MAG: hydroxyisourate hydrolase [Acidimicrobiia bacterium]|nr:hydroxyisourate hydrolase [Acidimicrobiia bacterium]MBT8217086.1 hydroxyisourate hydrolase [Acidimicrobiia bacterium]NNF10656.1 hydroxyisourate hydrolase [Acidimicrobiia bacterium]NNL70131.1 hydroxyisourate hydrolase [Acidimicrobiia bacterium]
MSGLGTTVRDTSRNAPADRVPVRLEKRSGTGEWEFRTRAVTDAAGHIANLLPEGLELTAGVYRLSYDTDSYFEHHHMAAPYPEIAVVFEIQRPGATVHIPLELSPDGYATRWEGA